MSSQSCQFLGRFLLVSLLFVYSPFVRPEFVEKGSTKDFYCKSVQKNGRLYKPILKRNDDHNQVDPIDLFVGSDPRPIVDEDWTANVTKNATTGIETYHYKVENVAFEDAGIYKCDEVAAGNVTVIGEKVTCKEGAIKTKQGEKIKTTCTLPVDGPDEVDLGWFNKKDRLESKMPEPKLEDHHITAELDITAHPDHHGATIACRYTSKGEVKFQCEVSLDVEYPVQLKGKGKSHYQEDKVEAEIHVIGNPWPGKKSLSVKSDHILADQTEMDELDNGLGAEVTVHIPLSAFKNTQVVNVIVMSGDDVIGTTDIELPAKEGKVTYIVVIVILALAAILLVIGIIFFIQRSKSRGEPVAQDEKDIKMDEGA